jgi:hypothetical protein
MKITKTSIWSKKTRTMDLDITEAQIEKWENGELIQNAFPNLNNDEREFLLTGMTPEEWDAALGK